MALFLRRSINGPVTLLHRAYFSSGASAKGGTNNPIKSQLLANIDKEHPEIKKSSSISREKKFTFSSCAISFPHLLHLPKNFLLDVLRKKKVKARGYFDVHFVAHESRFYSATFTDPITNEVFSSGLGGKVNVPRHPSVQNGTTPLHLAEARIVDGTVFYRTKKLAEHAAAARAIDCYIFREKRERPSMIGKNSEKLRLCLEDPYEDETERCAQQVDYETLVAERDVYVSKEQIIETQSKYQPHDLLQV